MLKENKDKIITSGLAVLGIAMIVLGLMGGALPPAITGIGFLLLTWGRV